MEELPKQYQPKSAEAKWYDFWEREGFFRADPLSGKPPYCTVLPPPNITGVLHIGHALVATLQDALIRWRRMCGDEAVWIPGTDHAGISTQAVIEKELLEKKGMKREELSREELLSYAWQWKEEHEKRIFEQLKKLGSSCDWSRKRFTMDAGGNLATRTLFKKLFDEGLIYRGNYLVNWDPITRTALADDEVEYEEREGYLWYFRYPLEEGKGHLTIATTRPETMLGDVAVAVSPKDARYRSLVGKRLILPIADRKIPIIADSHVDPEFGTGAVKITPAHDFNDWEIGQRHALPFINLLNADGTLNENGLGYRGLTMGEAREQIAADMKEAGLLERSLPYRHRVGLSYRSRAVIEPLLSKQWFIKVSAWKEQLIDVVQQGRVKLFPKSWEKTYFHWIANLRDWCISRQLWWGHRIPIWINRANPDEMICYVGEGDPPEVERDPASWKREEDVLDTWFSSALWPFSSLGWPNESDELEVFYPNASLITGHDILFFWVTRMIMMGEYAMGKIPFREVSLQGLIYGKSYWRQLKNGGIAYVTSEEKKAFDAGTPLPQNVQTKWEKMSKSKGNVIDPIAMIDSYGADATRMALAMSATQGRQIDLDSRRFEECKNFMSKLWNGFRFAMLNLEIHADHLMEGIDFSKLTLEDRWIFSRLNRTIEEVELHLKGYHFDRFALCNYAFFRDEFCAHYIEAVKAVLGDRGKKRQMGENKQKILVVTLLIILRLIHPIAPFLTEEAFQCMKGHFRNLEPRSPDIYTGDAIRTLLAPSCTVAPFPQVLRRGDIDDEVEDAFDEIRALVHTIRNIRGEMGISPHMATDLIIRGGGAHIEKNRDVLSSLLPISSMQIDPPQKIRGLYATASIRDLKVMIPLPPTLKEREKKRLDKEGKKLDERIELLENKLANPDFAKRAPREYVAKTEKLLTDCKKQKRAIKEKMHILGRE